MDGKVGGWGGERWLDVTMVVIMVMETHILGRIRRKIKVFHRLPPSGTTIPEVHPDHAFSAPMGLYCLKVKAILQHPIFSPGHRTAPRVESCIYARPNKISIEHLQCVQHSRLLTSWPAGWLPLAGRRLASRLTEPLSAYTAVGISFTVNALVSLDRGRE